MKKALFTYDYGEEKMNMARELGYEVIYKPEKHVKYSKELEDVEIIVGYNPFSTLNIDELKNLKWIQVSSVGTDQIPKDVVLKRSITVTNNRGGYSVPMGEWIVMDILMLFKKMACFHSNQLMKKWKENPDVLELEGKTVGFIGTGTIAKEAVKRLKGFDVKVVGMNTNGHSVEGFDSCCSQQDVLAMLPMCDVLVLTIPYTNETRHFINEEKLNVMKRGAFLVNVARGSIIDENALISSLASGRLQGAALDVVENEPLSECSPLWEMENVIITPHNSWISEMKDERRFNLVYENMKRHASSMELMNVVDMKKGY